MADDNGVERVLIVTAHPDDCDFGCAGTTAQWTASGLTVTYCIATDGDAGGSDRSVSRTEMARIRRDEQRAAAAEVGVSEVVFLGYPDGRVTPSLELRRDITRVIRQKQPQRVVTQSPLRNFARIYASHPDHLAVGEAAMCAVYPDARNPFAHPELLQDESLEPHTVAEMWLMSFTDADQVVDVTDTIERKMAALRQHRSQYDDWDKLDERVRGFLRAGARDHGLDDGRMAELFQVIKTN